MMTVVIQLTQGQSTIVDDEDADLAELKWSTSKGKHSEKYQAVRTVRDNTGRSRKKALHRVVFERMLMRELGSWEEVNHRDSNLLNNRRENLRLATRSQSNISRGGRSDNSSGYRGVHLESASGRWRSMIKLHGKKIHIDRHDTPEEAARAYDAKAVELFGEFAVLNFPEEHR